MNSAERIIAATTRKRAVEVALLAVVGDMHVLLGVNKSLEVAVVAGCDVCE